MDTAKVPPQEPRHFAGTEFFTISHRPAINRYDGASVTLSSHSLSPAGVLMSAIGHGLLPHWPTRHPPGDSTGPGSIKTTLNTNAMPSRPDNNERKSTDYGLEPLEFVPAVASTKVPADLAEMHQSGSWIPSVIFSDPPTLVHYHTPDNMDFSRFSDTLGTGDPLQYLVSVDVTLDTLDRMYQNWLVNVPF